MKKTKGLYCYGPQHTGFLFGPSEEATVAACLDIPSTVVSREDLLAEPGLLREVECLITGWDCANLDDRLLDHAPRLGAVFHAAGSVKLLVATPSFWERGLRITSANPVLAECVAEFTLAQILLALKHYWTLSAGVHRLRGHPERIPGPGNYGSTVGLVSYGAIARALRRLLRPFHHRVLVYDPFLSQEAAVAERVDLVSLDTLFRESDVVSCHAPMIPATEGLLTGAHFAAMKPGATFINTARGVIVREDELAAVLRARPDLMALLDVTTAEPPPSDHPFFGLSNVVISPHIAGCMGAECRRMGGFIADEIGRYQRGEPLVGEVTRDTFSHRA